MRTLSPGSSPLARPRSALVLAGAVAVVMDDLAGVRAAPVAAVRGAVVTSLAGVEDAVSAPLDGAVRPAAVAARLVAIVAGLAMVDHAVAARRQRAQEG